MVPAEELHAIAARERAASGDSWSVGRDSGGAAVVHVDRADGSRSLLRLKRDLDPAAESDVVFVAHAREDVRRLIAAIGGTAAAPATEEVARIAARCAAASPAPWRAFLEDEGGIAGSNVIWIPGHQYEPDLYLWLDDDIAPGADFDFVAHARQDIPRLLAELS